MPLTPTEQAGPPLGDTPPHGQPAVRLGDREPTSAVPGGRGRSGAVADRERVTRRRAERAGEGASSGRVFEGGRPRRWRLSRRGRVAAALLVVLLLVAGAVAWYEAEANPFGPRGAKVVLTVERGEALGTVVAQLAREGVVGSSLAFRLWTVVHGSPVVLPGRYLVAENSSFSEVGRLLDAGPNIVPLDVAPGNTVAEMANRLSSISPKLAETFSNDARHGVVRSPYQPTPGGSLEGLLGSGTYEIRPGESARTILAQMVARFDAQARAAGLTPATGVEGLGAYQVVVLASIAQKEGYFTRYMGDVARVIYNRLAQGMRLDMTSTVLYSLGQDGGAVTPAQEQITTPYNTYLHPGLTPTPICVPSVAALRAAAAPPAGPWLYFELVTAKKGRMVFSATFTGQLRAEQEAAANRGS